MDDITNFSEDAILPEGFDPSDENFSLEAFAAEEPAPTTEQGTQVVDGTVTEPTIAPEVGDSQIEVPASQSTIKLKYNHEEREVGLDEATILAQKGLNYDKLDERLKQYEQRNTKSDILAKQLGYDSADEMLDAAARNFRQRQIDELIEAGNTEAMAEFLVEQRMAKAGYPSTAPSPEPQEPPTPEEPQSDGISAERKAELMEFVKAYPGVTKLPEEVIKANAEGVRLLVAYERYQNQAARNELAILKQNQASAAKAPVTGVTGKAASQPGDEATDPFLMGFNTAY